MQASREVKTILRDAGDMARGSGEELTTGHILLGMFTSTNRAKKLLLQHDVELDKILDGVAAVKREKRRLDEDADLLAIVEEHMLEAARRTDHTLVSSLHLLMALIREKSTVAYRAFGYIGLPPSEIRTATLAQLSGPRPPFRRYPSRASIFLEEPTSNVAVASTPEPGPQLPPPAPAAETGAAPEPEAPTAEAPTAEGAEGAEGEATMSEAATKFVLDPEAFPVLSSQGRNLTLEAAEGHLDPVVGRAPIIDALIDILNKRKSNNPCLVGEPGVGKTAIVEGLALAIAQDEERVRALKQPTVIAIDVGALVAGTELRGAFSRRMARLKDEVRRAEGRIIVFIDELHTLVGAGSGEGPLDAANDLKAALARGEFPCIGATTTQEYHRYIERDPALERRFQPVEVPEPSEEDTLLILQGVVGQYEAHHGAIFQPDALESAVRLSRRYIVERRLPDKAFNLIDTAGARAVRRGKEVVEVVDVAEVVAELASIPIDLLLMSDAERILDIHAFLSERVVGHDEVLTRVSDVIQRNSAGFGSHRPIGSFIFLGPTGVGKTETAKVLADFLFCSKEALTRFDMSEFMERHSVSRLLGAAPGYVGHEEPGQLTTSLNRRPYQIILFDEIEKAHPDVLHLLLQILDEGRITDARGQVLSFANTVIILTSNLGAQDLSTDRRRGIGFGRGAGEGVADPKAVKAALESARKALPPELWGRIDEKCVFGALTRANVTAIARLLIRDSSDQLLAEKKITYGVTDGVIDHLIERGGYEPNHGARPMRRAVQRECEIAIARAILNREARTGDKLLLDVSEGEMTVRVILPPMEVVEDDEGSAEETDGSTDDEATTDDTVDELETLDPPQDEAAEG